jgi:transcriptional regulator with XRE-family HTH domain
MDASEAALNLRQRLGLSRDEFARRAGVSAKMIQRIEGGQQPTTRVLMTLANVARDAGFQPIADLFMATRRANMSARVEAVSETERVRRVALGDLKYWSAHLHETRQSILKLLTQDSSDRRVDRGFLVESLRNAAHVMDHIRDEIEIPIAEEYSGKRMEEDEQIFQHHRPKLTYGLRGVALKGRS